MKILHTADWHLGQTFFENDRHAEHIQFLAWLKEQTIVQNVDLLLVAGDIFDSPNPSALSQRLYYSFLRDITSENPELQIIIIAGNHDSAARLEAPNPLLEGLNVTVRGAVKRDANGEIDYNHLIVPLIKGGYCLAVPYLRQGDYPVSDTYAAGVQKMYETLTAQLPNDGLPVIAMGHLQATGSEISDDDRAERTTIGGLETISPIAFANRIVYTALGHLHRAQRVSKREDVRYSGAPLPMSFAEKNNKQGVTLVTLAKEITIERLEFDTPIKLISIPNKPAPIAIVLEQINALPKGESNSKSPYLEVKVLITEPEPTLRYQIEQALDDKAVRLARLQQVTEGKSTERQIISYDELKNINPTEMANDVFKRKYGGETMPTAMQQLLEQVIKEVES